MFFSFLFWHTLLSTVFSHLKKEEKLANALGWFFLSKDDIIHVTDLGKRCIRNHVGMISPNKNGWDWELETCADALMQSNGIYCNENRPCLYPAKLQICSSMKTPWEIDEIQFITNEKTRAFKRTQSPRGIDIPKKRVRQEQFLPIDEMEIIRLPLKTPIRTTLIEDSDEEEDMYINSPTMFQETTTSNIYGAYVAQEQIYGNEFMNQQSIVHQLSPRCIVNDMIPTTYTYDKLVDGKQMTYQVWQLETCLNEDISRESIYCDRTLECQHRTKVVLESNLQTPTIIDNYIFIGETVYSYKRRPGDREPKYQYIPSRDTELMIPVETIALPANYQFQRSMESFFPNLKYIVEEQVGKSYGIYVDQQNVPTVQLYDSNDEIYELWTVQMCRSPRLYCNEICEYQTIRFKINRKEEDPIEMEIVEIKKKYLLNKRFVSKVHSSRKQLPSMRRIPYLSLTNAIV